MQKEVTKEAATLEEAKEAIIRELGVPGEKICFDVLQQPQKKTLGLFGGANAMSGACIRLLRLPRRRSISWMFCRVWG